ncbi:hypothetical protein FZC78_19140 [Rossellomorea vietnamensis]|uniref:Phage protein n=1 Tax=Rossellomorea vietnamensis TaxID=218284 RepID=A0A5D4NJ50_9BACI|nr:hypothetical protein [Rossellomorea vietnamensis]TYS14273.1 hypothetical protein FZC78_19140 [Rossellomorea vietnamensis]
MAKLSDLVNVDINRNAITIQGKSIPVVFTFRSFPYVEEAYGEEYEVFEQEINEMLINNGGRISLGKKETKLMHCLIYAMVRAGGTECTMQEIEGSIPLSDLPGIFQVALDLFSNQNFQKSDMDMLKTEKKN